MHIYQLKCPNLRSEGDLKVYKCHGLTKTKVHRPQLILTS